MEIKSYTFTIDGRLPTMNEIIASAKKGRGNYQPYSEMKREYTELIAWTVISAKVPVFNSPRLVITWYEKNKKRDMDNIVAGKKFILDGLVTAGIIKDDSRKYINSIHDIIKDDSKNPRIEVTLTEEEE